MASLPTWFKQLKWTTPPLSVARINIDRAVIPDFPGCYIFTLHNQAISPGRVLYLGEATKSLRRRLCTYLVDFRNPRRPSSPNRKYHKGCGFVLEAREKRGDQGVYVRWVEYGAGPSEIHILEASLQDLLEPECNDRDESQRHPLLDHSEMLDQRAIR